MDGSVTALRLKLKIIYDFVGFVGGQEGGGADVFQQEKMTASVKLLRRVYRTR